MRVVHMHHMHATDERPLDARMDLQVDTHVEVWMQRETFGTLCVRTNLHVVMLSGLELVRAIAILRHVLAPCAR